MNLPFVLVEHFAILVSFLYAKGFVRFPIFGVLFCNFEEFSQICAKIFKFVTRALQNTQNVPKNTVKYGKSIFFTKNDATPTSRRAGRRESASFGIWVSEPDFL